MDFYEERDSIFDESATLSGKVKSSSKTELQKFYTDKTILITGSSGFLGMLLIEKLLRACTDVKKLILIIRNKKGKTARERVKDIFANALYEPMKVRNPDFWKQITVVSGSCELPNFGISEAILKPILEEVNIFFHAAATVQFDDHIRMAYTTNVVSTKTALQMAEQMPNLQAFVYVSTAYSQCHLPIIEEKVYPPAMNDFEINYLLDNMDDSAIACLTPIIKDKAYNTYIMTKSMAENEVAHYFDKLPVAIFRPSIMTSTLREPLHSWTNNIYGCIGVVTGTALGFLRELYSDGNTIAEIIPADKVINSCIALPQDVHKKWKDGGYTRKDFQPVYNYVADEKITWNGLMTGVGDNYKDVCDALPDLVLWPWHLSMEKSYSAWMVNYYIKHLLPLPFFLLMEKLARRKPRLMKGYVKMYHFQKLLSFAVLHSWLFKTDNVDAMYSELDENDKLLFDASRKVEWIRYFFLLPRGIGKYVLGVDWNKIDQRLKLKSQILYVMDAILMKLWMIGKYWIWYKIAKTATSLLYDFLVYEYKV